jgi:hypothetical protein
MSDNPKLTARDRLTVSGQSHEISHMVDVLKREFPHISPEDLRGAIEAAKKDGDTKREAVLQKAREALEIESKR